MKKTVFSVIFLIALFAVLGAMAESVVDMPFGLKWVESFTFSNGVKFGMTKEDVDSHAPEGAGYRYDESGKLYSVVFRYPVKDYDSANSDYLDVESQIDKKYGKPIGVSLIYPSNSIIDESAISGESKHADRIVIEGKDSLITIEHYLFAVKDPNTTNHYQMLVYSLCKDNEYKSILLWHIKNKSIY